jgi:long-subunit fatty acid transport protein
MDNYYKHADIIRAGVEVTPAQNFSARAGFQYSNSGIKDLDIDNYVGSLGFGYNDPSGFFVDVAYMQYLKKTTAIYDAGDLVASYVGNQASSPFKTNMWKLLFTFGYRF